MSTASQREVAKLDPAIIRGVGRRIWDAAEISEGRADALAVDILEYLWSKGFRAPAPKPTAK
jgi:hypothetical protein